MTNILDSFLNLLFERESPAAKQAKQMKLVNKGVGLWGPNDGNQDNITYSTRGGKLQPVGKDGKPTTAQKPAPKQAQTSVVPPSNSTQSKIRIAPPEALPARQSSKRSEISAGLIGASTTIEKNGVKVPVRHVLDEKGRPIDVSTTAGRKRAIQVLDDRLDSHRHKMIAYSKDFKNNREAQQWLGQAGEVITLRDFLAAGVETYLLPDSAPKNDLVFFQKDKKKGLTIVEISVKSSTGEVVGQAGSNIRPLMKATVGNTLVKFGGRSHTADSITDALLDVNNDLTRFLTDNMIEGKDRHIVIPSDQKKNFDSKYDPAKITGDSQSALLKGRKLTSKDLENFTNSPLFAALIKQGQKHNPDYASLVTATIQKIGARLEKNSRAYDLQSFLRDDLAELLDKTQSTFSYGSDLVAVKFNTETGYDDDAVHIIGADILQKRAVERLGQGIKTVHKKGVQIPSCFVNGRITGKCQLLAIAQFRPRTRALFKSHGNYTGGYLGPIVNAAPPLKSVRPEDRQSVKQYLGSLNEIIEHIVALLEDTTPSYYQRFKGVPPEILNRELTYNPIDPKTGRLRIDKTTGGPKISKVKLSNVVFTPKKYEKYPALVNTAHSMIAPYMEKDKEAEPKEPEEPVAEPYIATNPGATTAPVAPVAPAPHAPTGPTKIGHVFPANHHAAFKNKFSVKYLKHLSPYKSKKTAEKHFALLLLTVLLYFKRHKKSIIQKYFGNREDLEVLKRLAKQIVDILPTDEKLISAAVDCLDKNGGDLIFTFEKSVYKIVDFDGFAEGLHIRTRGTNVEKRIAKLMTKLLPVEVLQQPDCYYFIHDILSPVADLSLIGGSEITFEPPKVTYTLKNINSIEMLVGMPNDQGDGYIIFFANDLLELLDIN